MTAQWWTILSAVLAVFAVICVGAAARRCGLLTQQADQSLIKVLVNILFPALIFQVILGNSALLQARNIVLPPLVGAGTILGGFVISYIAARSFARPTGMTDSRQVRTFALCIGIYNYLYIPLPLIQQLFKGNDTVAVLFVYNVGVELAMWTIGILLVSGHMGGEWYKRAFNVPSASIVLALLLNFLYCYGYVPLWLHPAIRYAAPVVDAALGMMGRSAIPLALLLIGGIVADDFAEGQLHRGSGTMALGCLLRLGLLPAAFLALAYFLPAANVNLRRVIAVQAAMPCAVFPVVLARHYGGHPPTAIRVVLATSVLSLLTTPLWLKAGLWLLR